MLLDPLLLLHYLTEKKGDSTHRGTCHWGWGAATPPPPPPAPPNFEQLRFLGATRKIWADQILTKVSMFRFVFFFFERVIFFILSLSRRGKAS